MMFEQQPVLDTIPEKEVQRTPVKGPLKAQSLEDCHSTDEGSCSFAFTTSSCASDEETSSAQCAGSERSGSQGIGSSCTSDDDTGLEADVDSSESGLNSSCASDDEDDFSVSDRRDSDPGVLAKLPSVGSVGHYGGQCSRCCFFPKGRCTNGENCNFCHLDHERVRRKRGGGKKAAKAAEAAEEGADELQPKVLFKDEPVAQVAEKPETKVLSKVVNMPLSKVVNLNMPVARVQAMQPVVQPVATSSIPLAQMQRIPTPQCPRSSAPIAEQLTSKLLAVSAGRPVKVWLPSDCKPLKLLDASIPAKKKPSFPEYASDKKKTLDPSVPCKKHMPSWLMNLDTTPAAPKPTPQTFAPAPQAPVFTAEPAPR